jgi:hypothetical protein
LTHNAMFGAKAVWSTIMHQTTYLTHSNINIMFCAQIQLVVSVETCAMPQLMHACRNTICKLWLPCLLLIAMDLAWSLTNPHVVCFVCLRDFFTLHHRLCFSYSWLLQSLPFLFI